MEPREINEVERKLRQVNSELAWESNARPHPAHGGGHEMVEVSVGGNRQLESADADVMKPC